MKSTIQLTSEVVVALQKFNNSEKTVSDRIALRAVLFSVVAETTKIKYEGEMLEVTDEDKTYLCEELIPEIIPLKGELERYPFSIGGSGSLGYTVLSDSYEPARFVKF